MATSFLAADSTSSWWRLLTNLMLLLIESERKTRILQILIQSVSQIIREFNRSESSDRQLQFSSVIVERKSRIQNMVDFPDPVFQE
jgi:hypothetical protein